MMCKRFEHYMQDYGISNLIILRNKLRRTQPHCPHLVWIESKLTSIWRADKERYN